MKDIKSPEEFLYAKGIHVGCRGIYSKSGKYLGHLKDLLVEYHSQFINPTEEGAKDTTDEFRKWWEENGTLDGTGITLCLKAFMAGASINAPYIDKNSLTEIQEQVNEMLGQINAEIIEMEKGDKVNDVSATLYNCRTSCEVCLDELSVLLKLGIYREEKEWIPVEKELPIREEGGKKFSRMVMAWDGKRMEKAFYYPKKFTTCQWEDLDEDNYEGYDVEFIAGDYWLKEGWWSYFEDKNGDIIETRISGVTKWQELPNPPIN